MSATIHVQQRIDACNTKHDRDNLMLSILKGEYDTYTPRQLSTDEMGKLASYLHARLPKEST